ncbi:hypothetical protein C8J57DRAFT_1250018 [Mycena rebaudengoi]|nr:hypothetical protein C8J57DRAFT_1250018 [Mycena rebaudengoi]
MGEKLTVQLAHPCEQGSAVSLPRPPITLHMQAHGKVPGGPLRSYYKPVSPAMHKPIASAVDTVSYSSQVTRLLHPNTAAGVPHLIAIVMTAGMIQEAWFFVQVKQCVYLAGGQQTTHNNAVDDCAEHTEDNPDMRECRRDCAEHAQDKRGKVNEIDDCAEHAKLMSNSKMTRANHFAEFVEPGFFASGFQLCGVKGTTQGVIQWDRLMPAMSLRP